MDPSPTQVQSHLHQGVTAPVLSYKTSDKGQNKSLEIVPLSLEICSWGPHGSLAVVPGEAGSGQWGGNRTSPEVFRGTLPPGRGRWELGKSKELVLRLDKAQEEGMEEEESAKRKAQKREEVPTSINLKA